MLDERLGKWNFWMMLIGFNLTFFPMHIVGLDRACRGARTRYDPGMGWDALNLIETIGVVHHRARGAGVPRERDLQHAAAAPHAAVDDPWDGRSLEWSIPSPPPEYNFAEIPQVEARDDWWHRKYTEDADGRLVRLPAGRCASSATTARRHRRRHTTVAADATHATATASTCRRRRSTRSSSRSGCRSSATPRCSSTRGSRSRRRAARLFGVYAWGLEPGDASRRTHGDHRAAPGDIPSDEVTDDAPGELGAGAPSSSCLRARHDAGDQHTGLINPKLGMWLFLSSDCLFFGAFIATFLLYRDRGAQKGPTPKEIFDIPFTSATSFILLMSSLTMVLALAAIQRGDHRRFRIWMLATGALRRHLHRRPDLRVHRVHPRGPQPRHQPVRVELLRAHRPPRRARDRRHRLAPVAVGPVDAGPPHAGARRDASRSPGLYWHFVDVVWIVIFTVIYLIPK